MACQLNMQKCQMAIRARKPERTVMSVVAQQQTPAPSRLQSPPVREVKVASAEAALHSPATSGWMQALSSLFFVNDTTQDADEEWYRQFGHLLDASEEHGHGHSMYVSHLAERMALELLRGK